jgi:ribosomal-protein-alanine N-acetyltransferase
VIREDIYPSEPRVLDAARLRLRPIRAEDAAAVLSLYSDDAVLRYLARPKLGGIEEAREFIERAHVAYDDGTNLQLAIERKDDDAFIGLCLLFRYHRTSRRAEMGYAIAPRHWARGYATEALRALVAHAFGTMGLNRLEADIDPRNGASARVLDRLGFTPEGILRERWIVHGEASDSRMYGLLRREWAAA